MSWKCTRRLYALPAAALIAFSALHAQPADAVERIKLGHIGAVDDVTHLAAERFKELAEANSDGRIQVDLFPAGQLGGPRDLVEGLEFGTVEVVIEPFSRLAHYTPLADISSLLFMIRDRDHFEQVWNGPLGEEILGVLEEESGLKVAAVGWRSERIITATTPIHDVSDVEGLGIRVPPLPLWVSAWEALGASPTPMEFTEVFTGLQTGVIQAQENPMSLSYTSGFGEVARYWSLTGHLKGDNSFLMSQAYFDGLPEDLQQIVLDAAAEAAAFHGDYIDEQEADILTRLEDEGITVIEPDVESFMAKLDEAGFIASLDPQMQEWYEAIVAIE